MLQVSGSCAHIWDPNSVYAYSEFDFNPLRIRTGLVLMYLQLILTPYTNEWV